MHKLFYRQMLTRGYAPSMRMFFLRIAFFLYLVPYPVLRAVHSSLNVPSPTGRWPNSDSTVYSFMTTLSLSLFLSLSAAKPATPNEVSNAYAVNLANVLWFRLFHCGFLCFLCHFLFQRHTYNLCHTKVWINTVVSVNTACTFLLTHARKYMHEPRACYIRFAANR